MKNCTLITRCAALVLALGLMVVSANAGIIGTTGQVVDKGQLTSGTNLNSGQTQGPNVKVYLETGDGTLASSLSVNRIGPNFGTFTNSGSGSGSLPAGTMFTDYLLHYDNFGTGGSNNAIGSITFDTPIIGLIVFTNALNNSDAALGVSGVTYENNQFRGLDDSAANGGAGNDEFSVSADHMTFFINGWTTTNVVDEVRILVAVPDGGSTAMLLGLSLVLLALWGRRRKIVA
jgi:hypothetical protein